MVLLHILAGLLAIVSGATALVVSKGSGLHVKSGLVFVASMSVLAGSGLFLAISRINHFSRLNGIAATLTFYLVLTGFLAMRLKRQSGARFDAGSAVVALTIGLVAIRFGEQAIGQPGPPAPAYLFFAGLALLAAAGDLRKLVHGISDKRLLARHLWRLGSALWIATASFFLGQAKVFPDALRKPALLAVPVLVVLATVAYWFVRVRFTKSRPEMKRMLGRGAG